MCAESYLREINTIDSELKRINAHSKNLREQKSRVMSGLHNYMKTNNLEKVTTNEGKNITINQCKPKEKKPRGLVSKTKNQRRLAAIELFKDAGIPNPSQFYQDFESTQKIMKEDKPTQQKGNGKKGKRNNNDYDDMLGF